MGLRRKKGQKIGPEAQKNKFRQKIFIEEVEVVEVEVEVVFEPLEVGVEVFIKIFLEVEVVKVKNWEHWY